ncbi:MAG: nicotinamide-nucleotide adenylyltransferase [Candidatus Gracilibacteria bacterium]|jgi:nicotinamide-nucleotide adenylyltransferase|nr:nicotinamide-nucleotide adenylyltransferase [Candidatus Gracilibacteria bacterium]
MKKRILYIGRFQPFHLGHLDAIKQIFEKESPDQLIIAIGSAECSFDRKNPFTASERYVMIEEALEEGGIIDKCSIIPIANINNNAIWVHYLRSILPDFQKAYSDSYFVKEIFKNSDIKTGDIQKRLPISATQVRQKMLDNQEWQKDVHHKVAEYIQSINGAERLINVGIE